jgi:hypothetical protein
MLLRSRPATLDDLVAGREALAYQYGNDSDLLARLPEVWKGLLGLPSIWSMVVEDLDAPEERRIVSYSLTAFVSESFANRIQAGEVPFLGTWVVRSFLDGGGEPITLEEIAAAQTGDGLNAVTLHSVCTLVPKGSSPPIPIGEHIARQNFDAMRGYRIRRTFREVYSPESLRTYSTGGWRLRSDYRPYFGDEATEPRADRPFLLGMDRREAQAEPGARMATLFVDRLPRLELPRGYRELLGLALEGLSDQEIADRLCVSISTIKKRWMALYEHVEVRVPGLLPSAVWRFSGGRGVERRRHLLGFVREHPEELRPPWTELRRSTG